MFDFLNFLRKKYAEKNDNPIRQGTSVDELAVKPTSMVLTDFYNTLVEKQQQDNIDNYANLTEEQMDYFGNKFFFPRQVGEKAFGVIRVWVDETSTVKITTDFRAASSDGLLFTAVSPRIISSNSMVLSNDSFGKYYFDIGIIAEYPGSNYNKLANEIQSITGINFIYKYVTNIKDMIPGSAHETNDLYYQRLKYSLNDRSLMNKRALYAGLRDRFPYIYSVYAAGAGNKYMQRDKVQAVDLSEPPKEAKYLGKIANDNIVKHMAYYQQFPAEAGSRGALFNGPFSISSNYPYPQTIEAVDLTSEDPAYHGYALYQEATDEMYRGLYYDDYRTFYEIKTSDLFNISDEVVTAGTMLLPNNDWYAGTHGLNDGDFGIPESTGLNATNLLSFTGVDISLKGGSGKSVTAFKDIKKRIGVKVSGIFKLPAQSDTAMKSAIQFIVAAPTVLNTSGSVLVDSYSGIGFGAYVYDSLKPTGNNSSIFFSHSERYGSTYVFSDNVDAGFGAASSLAESQTRLKPGKSYNFEFVIYDDLTLAVKVNPVEDTSDNDNFNGGNAWILPSTSLKVFQNQIMSQDTDKYGTNLKITLDTTSTSNNDEWMVSNLKVVDLAPHRPTALFMFNVDGLEEPLSLRFRGTGTGAVNNALQSGHSVYVWNLETPGPVSGNTALNYGGWQKLDGVSNPDGSKDVVSQVLAQDLVNIDRYIVSSRFGNVIVFMVVAEGQSRASLTVNNDTVGDINANLSIDYIKLQDQQIDVYRGNNKCDVYINTIRNADSFKSITTTITRNLTDSYFAIDADHGFEMPIVSFDSVIDATTNIALDSSEYTILRDNVNFINSVQDSLRIVAPNYTSLIITYSIYNHINMVQDYFDGPEYGKIFGSVLIKHKFPTYLDFQFAYAGTNTPDVLTNAVVQYFDSNVDRVFDINSMIQYMYSKGYTTYIPQPIIVSYSRLLEDGTTETGTFNSSFTIRDIDFFRVRNVTASQL